MADVETFEAGIELKNGEAVFVGEDKKVYPVVARTQRFVKKPVVVDAVQFLPSKDRRFSIPAGVKLWDRNVDASPRDMSWGYIETLEGRMHVCAGDWIVTGVQGERYPVKPDIFEQTYEAV
jgi:hypothetical protein